MTQPKVYPFLFRGKYPMRVIVLAERVYVEELKGKDALGNERWHAVDESLIGVHGWNADDGRRRITTNEWLTLVVLAVLSEVPVGDNRAPRKLGMHASRDEVPS
jgi:hypothetical protein